MKIAVVCSIGLGDCLIMHIASHHLSQAGYDVTTFSDHLEGFGSWLKGYSFAKQPKIEEVEEALSAFDAVILQHDNSEKAKKIRAFHPNVYGFFGSHLISKHGPLTTLDYVCDPSKCMVENVVLAMQKWFQRGSPENGFCPPPHLIHKKNPKKIIIHSGSSDLNRNWPLKHFQKIARNLEKEGYAPFFITKNEKPVFSSLEELASEIYESGAFLGNDSGPGHLASCLQIPSLIIGKDYKHLQLWMPGWLPPVVVTPPKITSYFKCTRPYWKHFIRPNQITKQLKTKVLK